MSAKGAGLGVVLAIVSAGFVPGFGLGGTPEAPETGMVVWTSGAGFAGIIVATGTLDGLIDDWVPGDFLRVLNSPFPLELGDLVTFDTVGSSGGAIAIPVAKIGSSTVITGPRDGPVEVAASSSVLIADAAITGKVTVKGGILVIIGNSVIDGKVDIDNGSTVVIVKTASGAPKINGKIESFTKNFIFIRGCEIEGKVTSNQDNYVEIQNCIIGGKLELLSKPTNGCNVSNNTVTGKVSVPAECTR